MDNNIYDLEKYKQLLELQKKYDNDLIEEDELSLEEINSLITLYKNQIKRIRNNIKMKYLKRLSGDYND